MKTNRITYALITVAALAALVAVGTRLGIDGIVGYGTVIALIALAAGEYRLNLRRVFGNK